MCVVIEGRWLTTLMKGGEEWAINHLQMYACLSVCECEDCWYSPSFHVEFTESLSAFA